MTFADLPIGARFKFFGKIYTKIAPSMAHDENRTGHIFGHTEFRGGENRQHEVEPLFIPENAPPGHLVFERTKTAVEISLEVMKKA
jgi:hypothetical protein